MARVDARTIANQRLLREGRKTFTQHEQLVGVAVAAKLIGTSHTIDDPITQKRWVFNRFGELIRCRSANDCNQHSSRKFGTFFSAQAYVKLA